MEKTSRGILIFIHVSHLILSFSARAEGVKSDFIENSVPEQTQNNQVSSTSIRPELDSMQRDFYAFGNQAYTQDDCDNNVINLFKLLKRGNPSLLDSNFEAFYIAPIGGYGEKWRFQPYNSRSMAKNDFKQWRKGWLYHVILVYRGKYVLDLDYGSEPKITRLSTYIEDMFFNTRDYNFPNRVEPSELGFGRASISDWIGIMKGRLPKLREFESIETIRIEPHVVTQIKLQCQTIL